MSLWPAGSCAGRIRGCMTQLSHIEGDRKSTRLNSSHSQISYAVFCLKKKTTTYQAWDVVWHAWRWTTSAPAGPSRVPHPAQLAAGCVVGGHLHSLSIPSPRDFTRGAV